MIIQLTRTLGNKVAVNMNLVLYMEKNDYGATKIAFTNDAINVKESLDEILKMTNEVLTNE